MPISSEDIERLRTFQKRVDDLFDCGFVSTPTSPTVKLHIRRGSFGGGISDHDEDDFRSFVMTLRQFTLQREPVHFERICNILRNPANHVPSALYPWVGEARDVWRATLRSTGQPTFSKGGKTFTVADALDLLWHGQMIHSDSEKGKELESMSGVGLGQLRFLIHQSVRRLLRALDTVSTGIGHFLDFPEWPIPPFEQDEPEATS